MREPFDSIQSASRRLLGIGAISLLASMSFPAIADDVMLTLTGDKEVPPVTTSASGNGVISIKPDKSVSGSITTKGIAGTMAHIHQGHMGANGPVIVGLERSGDNGWRVPDGAKLTEEQFKAYQSGDLYVNVHSAEHKGGEIRAQLPAAAPAPMAPMAPKTSGGY
jgi:hypothetical protein